MTIVLTGGGSGGHITPILAVASELKRLQPGVHLVYIGQTGDGLGDIPAADPNIDEVFTVRAGKFRRYHGEGFKQLLDIKTMTLNARDTGYVIKGLWQSRRLLKTLQPDLVFIKGGFVGVPVGLAAAQLGIPYITHDSDAIPGLANRIIAKWAAKHAVAMPADVYSYPLNKTISTGIPLQSSFVSMTPDLKMVYRDEIKVPQAAKMLFIIGGGLGSETINNAISEAVPHLLNEMSDLYVTHVAGRNSEGEVRASYKEALNEAQQGRIQVFGYLSDVFRYSGAADVVVTRAGATNLAEFALQGKASVVIPSPFLTGGHQLKNADVLAEQGAVEVLDEVSMVDDPNRLAKLLSELLRDPKRQQKLGEAFQKLAKPHASHDLAMVLLEEAKNKQPGKHEVSKSQT
jgi:UDP-N-acetylglucosamine--N-acetylmuramyl-(pentapeptide) pyrophosphoryl-undecaprenol N-acetylglucosamine transferase